MNELLEKSGIKIPSITAEEINVAIRPVLNKMETAGIKIDCAALRKLDKKLSKKLDQLKQDIYKLVGHEFNIDSPIQMSEVLFKELKLPTDGLKRTKSGVSTAARELNKILGEHKVIEPILEHREISKLLSTYLKPLPILVDEQNRLHTTFGLETSTGRLTSSEPNLQNIPIRGKYGDEIRSTFIAEKGMKLIAADYSQIELRIVACLAHDTAMIEAFKKKQDIHTRTASEIFNTSLKKVTSEQRRKAKAVNFGIVYGQTPYGLSQSLGISVEEAARYILHYFDIHRGIKDYINRMIEKARSDGYVETLFGSKRYLPNINSSMRFVSESEERMAINTPVQGTASEILKLAMIQLDKELSRSQVAGRRSNEKEKIGKRLTINDKPEARMLLTVHDEIVVEAPEDQAKEVAEIMENVMETIIELCVPMRVEIGIGKNWSEAK